MNVLQIAARDVAGSVCLRTIPVVAFVCVTRRLALGAKVAVLLGVLATGALLRVQDSLQLGWVLGAYAYLVVLCSLVPWAAGRLEAGVLTRGGLFVAAATVFFIVPVLTWPTVEKSVALGLGWELTLSSYSYCVECASTRKHPALRECLFFLLVNPALVYTQRGDWTGPPRFETRGALRAVLGVLLALAVLAFVAPLQTLCSRQVVAGNGPSLVLAIAASGLLRFVTIYGRQSSVAHLQIGIFRQLGYSLPERYLWPIAATGVPDFWRRWNLYVSEWLERYVYWPSALPLMKRARQGWLRQLAIGAAIVLTFATIGALHEVEAYGQLFVIKFQLFEVFVFAGVLVVVCTAASRKLRAFETSAGLPKLARCARMFTERAVLWAAVAFCLGWWWE